VKVPSTQLGARHPAAEPQTQRNETADPCKTAGPDDIDRDFWFSLYDSLESLIFRDTISCRWVIGGSLKRKTKERALP